MMNKTVRYYIKLLKLSKPDNKSIVILFLTTIGESTYGYFQAEIQLKLIDNIHLVNTNLFLKFIFMMIFILCLGGISAYFNTSYSEKIVQNSCKKQQNQIRRSLNTSSFRKFEKINYGTYSTVMNVDTVLVANLYPKIIFPIIKGILQFSLALYFAFKNSWELAFIILGIACCSIFVPKLFKNNLREAQKDVQENNEELRTFFSHSLEQVTLVKVFNSQQLENTLLKNIHDKFGAALIRQQNNVAKMLSINNLITYLSITIQSFIRIWFVFIGKITFGAWMGLFQISHYINWPFWMLPGLIENLSQTEIAAERISHFIGNISNNNPQLEIVDQNIPVIKGENISFSYDSENVLNDFSFEINRNEILGLTWKSGEGKSTFIKILAGLYSPQTGQLIKNHANMKISYATQNELFFSDYVGNNISLSFDNDQSILNHSLEKASVDFLRNGTKLSLDTELNKTGQPLSGGQKKRINLARAFYHDSDILILDEPTASLDSETKKSVLEAIKTEKKKRTIILITHDQETFRICDRFLEKEPKKELAIL